MYERILLNEIYRSLELFARSLILTKKGERDNVIANFFLEYALCSNAVRHVLGTHTRG